MNAGRIVTLGLSLRELILQIILGCRGSDSPIHHNLIISLYISLIAKIISALPTVQ